MGAAIFEIKNISKSFAGVKVLQNVSFDIEKGEVHGLVGENGAGKSTLMKTISGIHLPDKGSMLLEGKEIPFGDPLAIQKLGVSIIYQEFSLVPQLSVAENIFLRDAVDQKPFKRIPWEKLYEDSRKALAELGINDVDPRETVANLSVAHKQIVEIAKALTVKAKLLIMDEPSATLNVQETDYLFKIINELKSRGVSIIYITHRLEELFKICDRITVLKDGEHVTTRTLEGLNKDKIVNLMVGRDVSEFLGISRFMKFTGTPMLSVKNLRGSKGTHDVNFELHRGEILGIGGLTGAGRSEMVRALCGLDDGEADEIILNDESIKIKSIKDAIAHGFALLPEERKTQGLILKLSVRENISYAAIKKFCWKTVIQRKKETESANRLVESLKIKCSGLSQLVYNLSGGNQQKVVIGKWLLMNPKIYIMDEPTRGIDVGAKKEIYDLIRGLTDQGASVIFISSELPELLAVSDRIMVMSHGTIAGEIETSEATEEKLLSMAVRNIKLEKELNTQNAG